MSIIKWGLLVFLAATFFTIGMCKIFISKDQYAEMFGPIAEMAKTSPAWQLKFIGLIEVVAAIGLLLPKVTEGPKELSYIVGFCLVVHMSLAIGLHFVRGDSMTILFVPLTLLLMSLIYALLEYKNV